MRDALIPNTLVELEHWFASLITAPIQKVDSANIPLYSADHIEEIRKRISPSPTLKSEERIGIYQQQYWWRLIAVCQEIFPALTRLFGYSSFNAQIAEPYLLKYPPDDWFLSHLGDKLPTWLQESYHESDAGLVLGLAQIDLAYENLLFSETLEGLDIKMLSEHSMLFLHPSVFLFEFPVDLFSFHTKLLAQPVEYWETSDLPSLKRGRNKKRFALFRQKEQNRLEELSLAQFRWLSRFQKGAKLSDLSSLLERDTQLLDTLIGFTARGWLYRT